MKLSAYPPSPMFPSNLLFTVIAFALLLSNSVCVAQCQNQTCGFRELVFPFQKSGCGLQEFQIDCVNDLLPVLQINSTNYTLIDVFPNNQTFTMATVKSFQTCASSSDGNDTRVGSMNDIFNITAVTPTTLVAYNCLTVCVLKGTWLSNSMCLLPLPISLSVELLTVHWDPCFSQNGTYSYQCPKGKNRAGAIAGGIVGGLAFVLAFIGCTCLYQKKKKKKSHTRPEESSMIAKDVKNSSDESIMIAKDVKNSPDESIMIAKDVKYSYSIDIEAGVQAKIGNLPIFSYEILKEATNNFDDSNMLGNGGYGTVYLGKLPDGRTVAVKKMSQDNNNRKVEQFINEIELLSSLYHPNLVHLYGCTSPESSDLLLVYEYVPNGTVADHLHGKRKGKGLNWDIRLKICLETARALAFLHSQEPPVLHRDVKTTNILLDENFKVKVADFGLSRIMPPDVTHVYTAPQGTPGYVDPESYHCFMLTEKSDVYSFGVVLVEIISGKLAMDMNRVGNEIALSNMAITKIKDGALHELVDAGLGYDSDDKINAAVTSIAELALSCLQSVKDERPSMKELVAQLEQIRKNWSQS